MGSKAGSTPSTYSPSTQKSKHQKPTSTSIHSNQLRSDGRGFYQCRPACMFCHPFLSSFCTFLNYVFFAACVVLFQLHHVLFLIRYKFFSFLVNYIWVLQCFLFLFLIILDEIGEWG